jgi:hypothetical protein
MRSRLGDDHSAITMADQHTRTCLVENPACRSQKAPWTRTMVLTAAYAGDDAAKAAPVRRARIKRFMVQLR